MRTLFSIAALLSALHLSVSAQPLSSHDARSLQRLDDERAAAGNHNRPEREAWLQDAGFGLFIHFNVDSQLGITISHSLVGASEDYVQRYFRELPQSFDPSGFDAKRIARLAKLAGMKYIVFTAKHHSGFCFWNTTTTDFNIMRTPFARDLLKDYVEAVRAEGLAVGLYFSPEDFHFLHEQGVPISRNHAAPLPAPVMAAYTDLIHRQCTELMTNYGGINVFFIDGEPKDPVRDTVWRLQPDCLITRGAIATPEQNLPGVALDRPWESCVTMGVSWQYQATNENLKSGSRLIQLLVETRAKGGALLLNIGPRPDGSITIGQEDNLREMAAWHFVNQEAVHNVRPWIVTNEGPIWFTKRKDGGAVFAIIPQTPAWPRGERRDVVLHSVEAGPDTKIGVLGQSDREVEYAPQIDAHSHLEQRADGLHVSIVRAQRLYDNNRWPNPVVVKLENVRPALTPPVVTTSSAKLTGDSVALAGKLVTLAPGDHVQVAFAWRKAATFADKLYNQAPWTETPAQEMSASGDFTATIPAPAPGAGYDIRAIAKHPKLTVEGDVVVVVSPQ